jgi:hypothetical protein
MNHLQRMVNVGLMPEAEAKKVFEAKYGTDAKSRTPEQWRQLVKAYSMDVVMEKENMDAKQVLQHCHESWSQSLKRQWREKRKDGIL